MRTEKANLLLPEFATINQRITETPGTFSLHLSPEKDISNFNPGQFTMIGVPGFGEASFSFSFIDKENNSLIQTIRYAGNVVSAIADFKQGQKIHFRGPFGNGWPLKKLEGKHVIVVAGGIGMAPLRPVIHYLLDNLNKFGNIYLLYGARTPADILFKNDLEKWSESINVLLSADEINRETFLNIRKGLVTSLFDEVDVSLNETVTFTCGPQVMMKFVAAELILNGQNPGDIYLSLERNMKCGIGHCGHCQIGAKYVCTDGPVFSLSEIRKYPDTLL